MLIPKQEIENFIPQRPPFILIDNLIEASADLFRSDFRISEENIFVDDGYMREFALIENIAQTSSAGLAVTKKYSDAVKPEGYLGAISKLKLYSLPKVNDTIQTKVQLIAQLENMFLVRGVNYLDGELLMECELKLAGV